MSEASVESPEMSENRDMKGSMPPGGWLQGWPLALVLLFLSFALAIGLYWESVSSAVSLWYNRSAYNHGFLILPISGYLIWKRREVLAGYMPQPSVFGLGVVFISSLAWLAANVAGVSEGEHFAVVGVFNGIVLAVLGVALYRAMTLPMVYLWLMVPTGTFVHPILQTVATKISSGLLSLSGIPIYLDGYFIEVPTGTYEVAPGCSGLNFILAGLALAPLYGYFMYSSIRKRIIAIVAMLVAALVANGVRIYAIIALAEFSNRRIDIVDDHLIYGWGFFAAVLLLLGWIGLRWADGGEPEAETVPVPAMSFGTGKLVAGGVLTLIALSVLPLYGRVVEGSASQVSGGGLALESLGVPMQASSSQWQPDFPDADAVARGEAGGQGSGIEFYAAHFSYQSGDHELLAYGNRPVGHNVISRRHARIRSVDGAGSRVLWRVEQVRFRREQRLVASTYFVDGQFVVSSLRAKLLQAKSTLLWGRGDAGFIAVSVAVTEDPAESEEKLMKALAGLDVANLFVAPRRRGDGKD